MTRKKGICIDCGKINSVYTSERCRDCWKKYIRINAKASHERRKDYARDWTLKKKYNGFTLEDFNVYWIACRGKCFICNKDMKLPNNTQGQSLDVVAVDHNHINGKVRGLLCNSCNKAIGLFNDNIELMNKAIKYLKGE
jgi:hypothetical protein